VLRIRIDFSADPDPAVYLNAEKFAKIIQIFLSKMLESVVICSDAHPDPSIIKQTT
jgi:hypothetical protein